MPTAMCTRTRLRTRPSRTLPRTRPLGSNPLGMRPQMRPPAQTRPRTCPWLWAWETPWSSAGVTSCTSDHAAWRRGRRALSSHHLPYSPLPSHSMYSPAVCTSDRASWRMALRLLVALNSSPPLNRLPRFHSASSLLPLRMRTALQTLALFLPAGNSTHSLALHLAASHIPTHLLQPSGPHTSSNLPVHTR